MFSIIAHIKAVFFTNAYHEKACCTLTLVNLKVDLDHIFLVPKSSKLSQIL